MHRTVVEAFSRYVKQGERILVVHVPRCSGYISKEDKRWWVVNECRFPEDCSCPEKLLRSERIPPVHRLRSMHSSISTVERD